MCSAEQAVRDRLEIHELRGAYARAIDYGNYEEATEIFTDDAVVNYRGGTCHGGEEVAAYWCENVAYEFSMHTVQMPELSINGDEATGRWYMIVFYVTPDGDDGHVLGWYEDKYRRVNGKWMIEKLDMDVTYDTTNYHV
ncbi:hypothetical protein Htur_3815 (plasmid) [Haloterrigena turkmenica DSM 5511]|uniref:SnoaL-like domain-containing protein n=1 Tax=Haloterrigena turkmenica (strain ATCC 51198 / DSM 5511 / JCM 9101 / NCIMB 13204 / VKM B-1734 / 4k) TaxID=543526 RepID=D2RZX8_HALTV|nr:nuclear transport factor 2 family protein [Haloterrigena turkmenica]ADB62675.1 hypothetical protein Htur_3815 [Haloterrigena turkmenica DSM 5511]